jgi:hypothetical protein
MVRLPTGRAAVEVCALPETTVTGLPMGVEPFSNCTVPAAVEGLMVAVSISLVPNDVGDGEAVAVVVVATGAPTTKFEVPVDPL